MSPIPKEGFTLFDQGRLEEAEALCRAHPDDPQAWHLLGLIALRRGRAEEAEEMIRRAISASPADSLFRVSLGQVLMAQGRAEDAVVAFTLAARLSPGQAWLWIALGESAMVARNHVEAGRAFKQALALEPNNGRAHHGWGSLMQREHRYAEAEAHHRRAVAALPDHAQPLAGLAHCLLEQGRIGEAVEAYRAALTRRADDPSLHAALLFALMHDPQVSAAQAFAAHKDWDKAFGRERPRPVSTFDPGRRLKVGYVSPDFWTHPVAFFFLPLLRAHDPARVEVFCYGRVAAPDATTSAIKDASEHWRDLNGLSEEEAAALIRQDGIDVLVEMAGHAGGLLGLFALRPAPVQVEWLGYMGGSGLSALDGRLSDPFSDPTDLLAGDRPLRLPATVHVIDPSAIAPPAPPPCREAGFVTFGSFNKLVKLNDRVLGCMAKIVGEVPASRLLIKCSELDDPSLRGRLTRRFGELGVSEDRLTLTGYAHDPQDHLAQVRAVDVALDAFPWSGVTTTMDALRMGKPVVSLAAPDRPFRVTACFLQNLGLADDLLARSEDEYVAKAIALGRTPERIAALTLSLPERLAASPLADAPAFARALEGLYLSLMKKERP